MLTNEGVPLKFVGVLSVAVYVSFALLDEVIEGRTRQPKWLFYSFLALTFFSFFTHVL